MRTASHDPDGSVESCSGDPDGSTRSFTNDALVSALKLVGWQGVAMTVQTGDGTVYDVHPPIIIGRDCVQFAPAVGCRPVVIPLDDIVAFDLP